jgi:transposase
MTKVKKFAGLDISKDSIDVCYQLNQAVMCHRFTNDLSGFAALHSALNGTAHCVMEATGPYYLKLATYLHSHGYVISVINPLTIRQYSRARLSRTKTDRKDARLIYDFAHHGFELALWAPGSVYMSQMQQLQALVEQLNRHRQALKNQLHAFEAGGRMSKETGKFLQKEIGELDKKIADLESKMEKIISVHHCDLLANITTIPGIGKKTAQQLIVISGGFKKFANFKQLAAYVGISPRVFESGKSIKGRGGICKMGMSRIRALLYMCSWSAIKHNQPCKALYERLVGRGKAKMVALIAVAHKLLRQAFAIANNNKPFLIQP